MVLLLVIALLLMIALMLALRGFVRQVVVIPLSYVLWFGGLLLRSIPQALLWVWLLLIVLLLATKSLRSDRKPTAEMREEPGYPSRERVTFWLIQVYQAQGDYFRTRLADSLRQLTLGMLAHQEGLTRWQVEQRLESEELDLPPEIRTFLRAKREPNVSTLAGLLTRLQNRLRNAANVLSTRGRSPGRVSSSDRDLESVVRFLEDRLDIKHGF
jgi:energy-coupling factor transporter transmembrane protein EcfT